MAVAAKVLAENSELPEERSARREAELELFGQHLFFLRNQRLLATSRVVKDEGARRRLGTVRRKIYDTIGTLDPETQRMVMKLAETTLDLYVQDVLELFSNIGNSLRLGERRAIRYKLVMEIINLNLEVLWEDVINRQTKKHLPAYFGRWLNRYKNWGGSPDGDDTRSSHE